jgi:hypothetical protein
MEELHTFETMRPVTVPSGRVTPIQVVATDEHQTMVSPDGDALRFLRRGWYEVLLTVEWSPSNRTGTRFSHTAIPDHHPLHSEAIDAAILVALSDGQQLLRGDTIFEPDDGTDKIQLEVFQDAGAPVEVQYAALQLREMKP